MNWLDIVLLVILAYFIFKGARVGFVKLLGGFIGIIAGAWAAGQFYTDGADLILRYFDMGIMAAIVSAFIVIFLGVNLGVSLIVEVITKTFKIIPFATLANRLIGAALGALQGLLLVGLIIWVITLFPFENKFSAQLKKSQVAMYFEYSTQLIQPILPEGLRGIDFTLLQDFQEFSDEQAEYLRENMPNFFDKIKDRQDRFEGMIQDELEKDEPGYVPPEEEEPAQSTEI